MISEYWGTLSFCLQGDKMDAKFDLTVEHPVGTALNENEVVYTVTPVKGGIGQGMYAILHQCFKDGSLISTTVKGIWFSGRGAKTYGTAYFFNTGDQCTGVVIDTVTGEEVSPVVTFP